MKFDCVRDESRERLDPDVWTAASLVINAVSMFAQLATLKFERAPRAKGLLDPSTQMAFEQLRQSIDNARNRTERLIRLLARSEGNDREPLSYPFVFGETQTYIEVRFLQDYSNNISQIALETGNISLWVVNLLQNDLGFAQELSTQISTRCVRIKERIREMLSPQRQIGSILDECLSLLREFQSMMDDLERARN